MSETVTEYVAALHKQAKHCSFEDTLDKTLYDRLVCDIANAAVQKCLLAEPKLTFIKTVTTAQSLTILCVISSLKYATFVISEGILQKYVKDE